jgi:putative nucleotidyltransferase with HDIG domain
MMKRNGLILRTEEYVRETMAPREGILMIVHDFKHVDRVRNWVLVIARKEGFTNLEIAEVTALLHDIGLADMESGNQRKDHGPLGAEIAVKYLRDNSNLTTEDIVWVADVIRHHSSSPSTVAEHLRSLGNKGKLLEIIRDGDNLDALGAVGLMRAFTSQYYLPEYDPLNIKGDTWALSSVEFQKRFGIGPKEGLAPVNTIIDQISQQIGYYDNLHTKTARNLATPLVHFMKSFVLQLEHEIAHQAI